jgi:hypothetical protein
MQIDYIDTCPDVLRQMTTEQLLSLGASRFAYLKCSILDGELAFLIVRADGVPVEVVDAMETAAQRAVENGFSFVTVH